MANSYEIEDSFFFTKQNITDPPRSLQTLRNSVSLPLQNRKEQLQEMFNQYNLFKYSKCFVARRKSQLLPAKSQRTNKQNYNSIKKESEKLKERLTEMQKQRRQLLQKLRLQNNK